jgi:hypothetical protein
MKKWELFTYQARSFSPQHEPFWSLKDKKTGKTDWDKIQELPSQGWELVSVTPITVWQGRTACLLYTFKRLIEEGR